MSALITPVEYLILKLIKTHDRPVTFPEMAHVTGDDKYLETHRACHHLLQIGAIIRTTRKEGAWIFVHYWTNSGEQLYKQYEREYQLIHFARPVQEEWTS